MNFSQADTEGNGLESRLREVAIGGIDEALRVWTEAAKTKDAALLEREIELRELQETLEQNRRDCQAWEDRLRMLESHLREREEKINEREQALEKVHQHLQAQGVTLTTEHDKTSSSADARYPEVAHINGHRRSLALSLPRPYPENVTSEFKNLQASSDPAVTADGSFASMDQAGRDVEVSASPSLQPSAHQVEDSKRNDKRFSLRSIAYSMTPSIISSIRSSTAISIADLDIVDLRSIGMSEPSLTYNALSHRQQYVLSHHTLQWGDLDSRKSLTWSDIPWPTFTELARPEELKQEEVTVYVKLLGEFGYHISPRWMKPRTPGYYELGPGMSQSSRGASDFLAEYIALWHPDRLEVRVLNRVVEWDRERVRICANKVAGILRDIAQIDGIGADPGAMPAGRPVPPRQESVSPKITSEPSEPGPMARDSPSNVIDGVSLPLPPTKRHSLRVAGPRQRLAGVPPPGPPGTNGAAGAAAGGADGWMSSASALASRMEARGLPHLSVDKTAPPSVPSSQQQQSSSSAAQAPQAGTIQTTASVLVSGPKTFGTL
jgi:hypothetical protein